SGLALTGASKITGTAGVDFASANNGTLDLSASAARPLTGGLFVNGAASVAFAADNQLGAAGGSVTLGGGQLAYPGAASATVLSGRTLRLGPSGGRLTATDATGTGTLVVAGPVSGPG